MRTLKYLHICIVRIILKEIELVFHQEDNNQNFCRTLYCRTFKKGMKNLNVVYIKVSQWSFIQPANIRSYLIVLTSFKVAHFILTRPLI